MSTIQHSDGTTRVHATAEHVHQSADASQWFTKDKPLPQGARDLLEKWSGIAPESVESHARSVQAKAFAIWPWPCLGQRFLELTTSFQPCYSEVMARLKDDNATFLDAGCCLGQDLRKLMYDGAPSSANLYGVDIDERFFDAGYELFQDKEKLKSTFVAVDLTKESPKELASLTGKIDIISAQSLFHAFTLEDQKSVARNFARLSRQGSFIFGRQMGNSVGVEQDGLAEGTRAFTHSSRTWTDLWQEVGELTDTKWKVEAWEEAPPARLMTQKWASEPNVIILNFVIRRVKQ